MKYDYFLAGRTRNREQILAISDKLRAAGNTVYCFLDNEYKNDSFTFSADTDPEVSMQQFESIKNWREDKFFREVFEVDMQALRDSEKFIVVFPAGLSAHMEIGAAYGMGKKCYSIGSIEKLESLYLMLEDTFETVEQFLENSL